MRHLLALSFAGVACLAHGAPVPQQPAPVRITVRMVGVRAVKGGVLRVGLHAAPGTAFPGPSPTLNREVAAADDVLVTFDAPAGEYAVAVHHDANANGRMDANLFGIPKEGYAVSNDVRSRFRPPRFEEARVRVGRDTTISVHLTY